MFNISIKHLAHLVNLLTAHGLDQKPLIMRKEKEASTGACSFASLKHHAAVLFEPQRFLDHCLVYLVQLENLLELLLIVAGDLATHFQL